jgi:3-phenylpropionate/trans-cinnamate dioxygenase ferredoxin subunit
MIKLRVASLSELPDGAGTRVEVAGHALALFRLGERVYAIGDTCSHAEASLSEGEVYVEDLEVECPLHGATFSLETGDALTLPATQPVPTFDVTVEGDDVFVEVG